MCYVTRSPEETRHLGARLAELLRENDVLVLQGDMGAGKSELTRGIARGLGIGGYITSPTFTILQVHEGGRLPLYHFDWYRLGDPEELYELSMDEYLHMEGVAVIEWAERAPEVLPESYLEITLTPLGEEERSITLNPVGNFREISLPKENEHESALD